MPNRLSMSQQRELLRTRQLTPVELVDAHLKQIEAVNPRLNGFVRVFGDEARAQARRAGEQAADGPLAGIPVTVKDSFDMAGQVTAVGSRLLQDNLATADSAVVESLKAAGAIILGRTNTPEFLYNYETDNHLTGRTNNPWNLERTPGGSSGGEAAAISSFCSAGGVGSDGGGSIRQPAHFCGIAGLKPTPGRVSAFGHWPEIAHPGGFMGVAGPLARSASDLKLLFEVLAGYDTRDPFAAPVSLRQPVLSGIRIEIMEQFEQVPTEPVMKEAVHKAASLLSDLGYTLGSFDSGLIRKAPNLWLFLFGELPAALMRPMLEPCLGDCHALGVEFYNKYRDQPAPAAARIAETFLLRDRMRAAVLQRLAPGSVILAPACGTTAFPHGARRFPTGAKDIGMFEAVMPLVPWNLLGFPSITIPLVLSSSGLPAGVQLIGRPYDDELLIELAIELETARGAFATPQHA